MPFDEDELEDLRKYKRMSDSQARIWDFLDANKGKLYSVDEIFIEIYKPIQEKSQGIEFELIKLNKISEIISDLTYLVLIEQVKHESIRGKEYYYISKY